MTRRIQYRLWKDMQRIHRALVVSNAEAQAVYDAWFDLFDIHPAPSLDNRLPKSLTHV